MKKEKTIFVTVFHSLISKNILNTNAVKILLEEDIYKIVYLVPYQKKEFFEKNYADSNIVIEAIDADAFCGSRTEAIFNNLGKLLIDSHYLHYRRLEILDKKSSLLGYIRHFLRELIVKLFSNSTIVYRAFRFADSIFSRKNIFGLLIEKYNPDLVFTTDIFEQLGIQLVREAKSRNINTIGMVRSWDNCLSKGLLRVSPDTFIVNNTTLKEELVELHGVIESKIDIVGLPQFDSFITEIPEERELFFKEHNLDPTKRLVMFAPAGRILSDSDNDICSILLKAQSSGLIPNDVQFFIRNHPQHPANLDDFKKIENFHIQNPGQIIDVKDDKATELTHEDQIFLRNILAHTDALLWVATSLCLDALVYDVPQIVLNFDGYDISRDYYHSVKKYHDEGHMVEMFKLKPFKIANSQDDLIQYINEYLNDRSIDKEGREKVRNQQLYKLDGKAGERIAGIIQKLVA